ncbi:serine/threonine-protein kinase pdik1l-like [Anneissia japonica]|uniref:serine/threonine-protein kinase pdik1l-like n=1 Tax=Anneissia japonica TaxID=1529436 RepID=UPI0014259DAD|nr:serine/threonine-protein kinase pdik1l-like [Anneissia japonica]
MDSFVIQEKLRDGFFGAEHNLEELTWKGSKTRLVKMIAMSEDEARCNRDVLKNTLLQIPKHENIARLKHVLLRRENYTEIFLCPVYKNVDGEFLNDYIMCRYLVMSDNNYKVFFTQLMKGVAFLHGCGFSHGFLNPYNVIVTQDKTGEAVLKLTDYGLAKLCGIPDKNAETKDKENACLKEGRDLARVYYAPPETHDADASWLRRCCTSVDMFSLGLIMYALTEHKVLPDTKVLAGYVNYPGYGSISIGKFRYENPSINFDQQFYSRCSAEFRRLLRRLLHVDPNARPSASVAVQLLEKCPSMRVTEVDTRQSRKRKRSSAMFEPLMSPPQKMCMLGVHRRVRRASTSQFVRRASKRLKHVSNTLQRRNSLKLPSH